MYAPGTSVLRWPEEREDELELSPFPGYSESESKALRVTNYFETGRRDGLGFDALAGNFDGAGISFGIMQWNLKSGTLQPMILSFAGAQPDRFSSIFGGRANELLQVVKTTDLGAAIRWGDGISTSDKRSVVEPWRAMFKALAAEPAYQALQLREVRSWMDVGVEKAKKYGLTTERGLAFAYDVVIQHGKSWDTIKLTGHGAREAIIASRRGGRQLSEKDLMRLITEVLAETCNPQFSADVRARRTLIIEGRGRRGSGTIDLDAQFGLSDGPWSSSSGSTPGSTPGSTYGSPYGTTPAPAPAAGVRSYAPAVTEGSSTWNVLAKLVQHKLEPHAVKLAILWGVRGENELTDLIFRFRHPERRGAPLQRHETALIREWIDLRDRLVRPALGGSGELELASESESEWELEWELPTKLSLVRGFTESESKAIWITNMMETGGIGTLGFDKIAGNFDGQGISFGLQQWNIGKGSLQPLLKEFVQREPARFDAAFGEGAAELRRVLANSLEAQKAWANRLSASKGKSIVEPWRTRFRNLAREPGFQDLQLRTVRERMNKAHQYCRNFGFVSERALALMYDLCVQQGMWWPKPKDREQKIKAAFASQAAAGALDEKQKLLIIADVIAQTSSSEWRKKVSERKRLIALGKGPFRGNPSFDLDGTFGLTDAPFTAGATAPASTPSAPSSSTVTSLAAAAQKGANTAFVVTLIVGGNRDEKDLTNRVFYLRHDELKGRKIQPHETHLAREWISIRDEIVRPALARVPSSMPGTTRPATVPAPTPTPTPQSPSLPLPSSPTGGTPTLGDIARNAVETTLVMGLVSQGVRDENELTNRIFFRRHPEKAGQKLQAHETQLAAEWRSIRDAVVRPVLARMQAGSGSVPTGAAPSGAQISPLARTTGKLRSGGDKRKHPVAQIVVHTTGSGPAQRARESGGKKPAIQYALDYYLNGGGGFAHYVIDYDGTIWATADESRTAWHAGWAKIGREHFLTKWTAPQWWSSVWGAQGYRTPVDLLPPNASSPNTRSIGIELLGNEGDRGFTDAQYASLARLITDLQDRHGLQIPSAPSVQLLGHEDVMPIPTEQGGRMNKGGGWDPGAHRVDPKFSWPKLWALVQSQRAFKRAG